MVEEQKPDIDIAVDEEDVRRQKDMAKMAIELKQLVEYTKKSCGNIDSIVIAKMKRIGIKQCYDIVDGAITNPELDKLIEEGDTVYYIDGGIVYYIPLAALE